MTRSELPIAVLISGHGSNLQALIEQQQRYGYRIKQVISNCPDAYGLQRAQVAGIPHTCIDHRQFNDRTQFEQALLKQVKPECQLLLLAGFMRVLSADFLTQAPYPLLNIHPSLLPAFKGLNTHQRAINAKASEHGCSIHLVTAELDSGPLLAQSQICVAPSETEEQLAKKVLIQEHQLYPRVVGMIASGRLQLAGSRPTLDGYTLDTQGYQLTNGPDQLDALTV